MPITASFNRRLAILLPSKDFEGNSLDDKTREEILDYTRTWFSKNFTGQGKRGQSRILEHPWLEGEFETDGDLIQEEIIEIYAFCSNEEYERSFEGLIELAEWVKEKADQECVAIIEDGTMHLVE